MLFVAVWGVGLWAGGGGGGAAVGVRYNLRDDVLVQMTMVNVKPKPNGKHNN